jgi:cobalt/nickel transport system permease protein
MMCKFRLLITMCLLFSALPDAAFAMHLAEGILPMPWALFWFAVSIPFIFVGLRILRKRSETEPHLKAMLGLVGAAVFIISCMPIPVPVAGTCSHPCGTGIAAILIGPFLSVLVASVALTLQALFLAHGGLSTLGANIFSMGVAGSFVGYGAFKAARFVGLPGYAAAFLAGLLSDWATYSVTSFSLASVLHTDQSMWSTFLVILIAFVPTQVPLGIFEGFLSAGAYRFISMRRPEFLGLAARGEAA